MQHLPLGRTGVHLSTLALGAMDSGHIGRTTQEEATALADAALEAGINSVLQRRIETHVLPVTEQYALEVLVWSPLASGWLSGAVRAGREVTINRSASVPQRFKTIHLGRPGEAARRPAVG